MILWPIVFSFKRTVFTQKQSKFAIHMSAVVCASDIIKVHITQTIEGQIRCR